MGLGSTPVHDKDFALPVAPPTASGGIMAMISKVNPSGFCSLAPHEVAK